MVNIEQSTISCIENLQLLSLYDFVSKMNCSDFWSKNQRKLDQEVTKRRFEGKVAVVVGGASGIGFAAAERFANDGATVALIDIDKSNGEKAAQYIRSEGSDKVYFYHADVTNKKRCDEVAEAIGKENGGVIDFLLNSAVDFNSKWLNSTYSDWRRSTDVNLYGLVAAVQACHPYLQNAESPAIVTVSSISGATAQPERWTYSATKAAIKMLTKNMALDLAKDNIRVNSVSPGWIWSPVMAKASPDGTLNAILPTVKNFTVTRRPGETAEVASVMAFLCSRDASYITGTDIAVDGGYTTIGPERFGDPELFAHTQKGFEQN